MTNEKVVDAVKMILSEVNGSRFFQQKIINSITETVLSEHRTIQQLFWSAILQSIIQYGDSAEFDLRNEDSVKFAKLVKELAIKNNMDHGLRYL